MWRFAEGESRSEGGARKGQSAQGALPVLQSDVSLVKKQLGKQRGLGGGVLVSKTLESLTISGKGKVKVAAGYPERPPRPSDA